MKVEKLIPPKISRHTIAENICCDRPFRTGDFNISAEKREAKTIVHCYGHGGSGWTTLFGSVNRALELFQETHPDRSLPIRIIGSGCMGLLMAIELHQRGYLVAGIFTKDLYDIPSWKAAGLYGITTIETSPEKANVFLKINIDTFLVYESIAQGKHPYLSKDAVTLLPYYCKGDLISGIEELEEMGMLPKREAVTLDFGNGVIHVGYLKYMTYFMNTTLLMQQFTTKVQALNIPIEKREVASFNDIKEYIIFNCTGLAARELNQDTQLTPVRGYLVSFNESAGSMHMDYMFATTVQQDEKEEKIYLIPKNLSVSADHPAGIPCFGALGGTFIPIEHSLTASEEKELASKELKRLIERSSQFFHGHPAE